MTLDKWTTGDTITETNINKRSIRRGTTTDRDAIGAAELFVGDHFFNETLECTQVLLEEGPNIWATLGKVPIALDSTEVTVVGTTPTEVKTFDFILDPATVEGFLLDIHARIKTSNGGTTGNCRIRLDDDAVGPPAELILTTTNTSFEIKSGILDISGEAVGRHTINVYMDDGSGDTITNDMLEVWII